MTSSEIDCLIERLRNDDLEAFALLSNLGRRAVNKLIPLLNDQGIEPELVEELLKMSCRLEDLEQLLEIPLHEFFRSLRTSFLRLLDGLSQSSRRWDLEVDDVKRKGMAG